MNFLAFLAGLDQARMLYKGDSPSKCVYTVNFLPSSHVNENKYYKGEMSAKKASPTRRAGSLPYKHHFSRP